MLDRVIGVVEAGKMWGISPDHVKRLCRDGAVVSKKIGKTWVIDKKQPNPTQRNGARVWEREGYHVEEQDFDADLKQFGVFVNGELAATINPADIDDMQDIVEDLDAGEDVDGWEDGMGNTITIDIDDKK